MNQSQVINFDPKASCTHSWISSQNHLDVVPGKQLLVAPPEKGLEPDGLQRSLPTQTIPVFCNCLKAPLM